MPTTQQCCLSILAQLLLTPYVSNVDQLLLLYALCHLAPTPAMNAHLLEHPLLTCDAACRYGLLTTKFGPILPRTALHTLLTSNSASLQLLSVGSHDAKTQNML